VIADNLAKVIIDIIGSKPIWLQWYRCSGISYCGKTITYPDTYDTYVPQKWPLPLEQGQRDFAWSVIQKGGKVEDIADFEKEWEFKI